MLIFGVILIGRLFVLQIVRGKSYQENYNYLTEKTETVDATRGNIYDRNGNLLAYSELAHAVTIEDKFSNYSTKEKNKILNQMLYDIIYNINLCGDEIVNNFGIYMNSTGDYVFANSGTSLQRFRADIFGYSSIDDLKSKKRVASIAFPRQIAIYLSRQLTDESFPRIGMEFGGRDHSTVIHSVDKITEELKTNKQLQKIIEEIKQKLQ